MNTEARSWLGTTLRRAMVPLDTPPTGRIAIESSGRAGVMRHGTLSIGARAWRRSALELTNEQLIELADWAATTAGLLLETHNLIAVTYGGRHVAYTRARRALVKCESFSNTRVGLMVAKANEAAATLFLSSLSALRGSSRALLPTKRRHRGQRCAGTMPVHVHRSLGLALARHRDAGVHLRPIVSQAFGVTSPVSVDLAKVIELVDKLRSCMDDQVGLEPLGLTDDELSALYYPRRKN